MLAKHPTNEATSSDSIFTLYAILKFYILYVWILVSKVFGSILAQFLMSSLNWVILWICGTMRPKIVPSQWMLGLLGISS